MNLKVFKGLLKNHGMQIDVAMSGRESLALMEQKTYHIIFMDHQMPEMDGVETLKQTALLQNNLSKDAVMIVLTANAVAGAKEMFLREGFRDYLSKPISLPKLEEMLLKYLPRELIEEESQQQKTPAGEVGSTESGSTKTSHVDWEKGRRLCMDDEDFFRELLSMFVELGLDQELERYLENADFENYRIQVHAVKTNLANIGASEVSEMAKQLELAIKTEHNATYVREHHSEFIAIFRQVVDEVKEYLSSPGV